MWVKATLLTMGLAAAGAASAAEAVTAKQAPFTADSVSAVLRAAGATEIKQSAVENDLRLEFKLARTTYVADLYECDNKPTKACSVVQFVAAYDLSPNDTVAAVNAFNKEYLYGKAVLDPQEGLWSMRVAIGQAGFTKEQLALELDIFVSVTGVLLEHMKNAAPVAQNTLGGAMQNVSAAREYIPGRWRSAPHNKR